MAWLTRILSVATIKVMKITEIRQQQKRQDRYSIYIDGKFSFGLNEAQLADLGLKQGQEFTAAELAELKHQAAAGKAYERAVRYVAIRPRSRWELEVYLKRKDYESPVIADTISRLMELELIDDMAFARAWVEYRQSTARRSRRKLAAELRQKRLDADIIDTVLAEIDDSHELANIKDTIRRKRRVSAYRDRQKLIAYLSRQGYPYGLVKQALEELGED